MVGGPALVITTKFGNYRTSNDFSVKHYSPQGFDVARAFYSPKYNNNDTDPNFPSEDYDLLNPTDLSKWQGKI